VHFCARGWVEGGGRFVGAFVASAEGFVGAPSWEGEASTRGGEVRCEKSAAGCGLTRGLSEECPEHDGLGVDGEELAQHVERFWIP
jgi:hypothetical protein